MLYPQLGQLIFQKEAERRLGVDQFDIKGFHDVVLNSGPMPLNVLEEVVKEWVDGLVRDGNGSSSKKRKTNRWLKGTHVAGIYY